MRHHLPLGPVIEGNIVVAEVTSYEAPKQYPPVDAEEEVVASNPPPVVEESANKMTSRFMGNHALINLKEEEEPAATVGNDPPT